MLCLKQFFGLLIFIACFITNGEVKNETSGVDHRLQSCHLPAIMIEKVKAVLSNTLKFRMKLKFNFTFLCS